MLAPAAAAASGCCRRPGMRLGPARSASARCPLASAAQPISPNPAVQPRPATEPDSNSPDARQVGIEAVGDRDQRHRDGDRRQARPMADPAAGAEQHHGQHHDVAARVGQVDQQAQQIGLGRRVGRHLIDRRRPADGEQRHADDEGVQQGAQPIGVPAVGRPHREGHQRGERQEEQVGDRDLRDVSVQDDVEVAPDQLADRPRTRRRW